jgi:hypothetical protein
MIRRTKVFALLGSGSVSPQHDGIAAEIAGGQPLSIGTVVMTVTSWGFARATSRS